MTGSRLVRTLAYEMQRRKHRHGVVTMCVGGGQGGAALFEMAEPPSALHLQIRTISVRLCER